MENFVIAVHIKPENWIYINPTPTSNICLTINDTLQYMLREGVKEIEWGNFVVGIIDINRIGHFPTEEDFRALFKI